jgi:hypothetical protein
LLGLGAKLGGAAALGYSGYEAYSAYSDHKEGKIGETERNAQYGSAGGGLAGTVIGGALGSLLGPGGTIAGGIAGGIAGSWIGEKLGSSTSSAPATAATSGSNKISKVISTGPGFNEVMRPDGSIERQEGSRNWRNNNPGNIEHGPFAIQNGAIGSDGRFAIFPDYETGRKAKEKLIFEGDKYKGKSLTDAISRYAPPSENNTGAYQSSVLAAVGGQNKQMGSYSAEERSKIMNAMENVEGFKMGTIRQIAAGQGGVPSATAINPPTAGTAVAASATATSTNKDDGVGSKLLAVLTKIEGNTRSQPGRTNGYQGDPISVAKRLAG